MSRLRFLAPTGALLAVSLVLGAGVSSAAAQAQDPGADLVAPPAPVVDGAIEPALPEAKRPQVLGTTTSAATDTVYSLVGDPDGVTLLRGTGAAGYAADALVQLTVPGVETGQWVGNFCLTEDGSSAGVVYGPRELTNDEKSFNEGGWAALVDTGTGEVTSLGRGYSLAYFNPGCGAGDNIALTRFDGTTTHLGSTDAKTAKHLATIALPGQVTSAIAAKDGTFIAATSNGLISADKTGRTKKLVATTGQAFDLTMDGAGGVSYIERKAETSTVKRLAGSGAPAVLARGAATELGLSRDGHGVTYILGGGARSAAGLPPTVKAAPRLTVDSTLSLNATVAVESVTSRPMEGAGPSDAEASEAVLALRGVASNTPFTVAAPLSTETASDEVASALSAQATQRSTAAAGSSSNPSEVERTCAVPRNDVKVQAYQPMPRQVEWAVNRAVRGELTEPRAANWRNLGMSAYTPQGMFPRTALTGGGQIPDQVLLGVLMQESNLWQASRYTSPGLTGNPLIGNYYGIDNSLTAQDAAFWTVDFDDADCGYGVGQITDGMRLPSKSPATNPAMAAAKQQAVAVDYAANIARAQQMLAEKWNQLQAKGVTINNNDPSKIENWFGAVWIYNTGYQGPDAKGFEGLGWSNNPANPNYPQNRLPFLDGNPNDAANPQRWPYPEKVMGFAAFSQGLVERQTAESRTEVAGFRVASWNGGDVAGPKNRAAVKPPLYIFCTPAMNGCNGAVAGACTRADLHCWYKGNATWKPDCATTCGQPFHRFEPATSYMTEASASVGKAGSFPPACSRTGLPSGAQIVDDVPLVADGTTVSAAPVNPFCASAVASTGSFTFDFGQQAAGTYPSKIDMHQLGGGLNAHFWFSHTRYSANERPAAIRGTWSLGKPLTGQWTRVYVHTPDHAGWTQQAEYVIDKGNGNTVTRALPQRTYQNEWRSLGVFQVNGVPTVTLSNITKDGGDWLDDIAWDAVAFEVLPAKPKDFVVSMGDSFSSGEGAPSPTGRPYYAESDNYASDERFWNSCHRSKEAWVRKATLATSAMTIGARADSSDQTMDFHQISCSGATTENLRSSEPGRYGLPTGGQPSGVSRFHELTQIDQGYLDANTTLVTLSIGGNDIGFSTVIKTCIVANAARTMCEPIIAASTHKKADEAVSKIELVLAQIQTLAPNAKIVILGYPPIFQDGVACVAMNPDDNPWLNDMAVRLNTSIATAAKNKSTAAHPVVFGDPAVDFAGRTTCSSSPAINGLVAVSSTNRGYPWSGDKPIVSAAEYSFGVSQQSVHPNTDGTTLYKNTLERALRK